MAFTQKIKVTVDVISDHFSHLRGCNRPLYDIFPALSYYEAQVFVTQHLFSSYIFHIYLDMWDGRKVRESLSILDGLKSQRNTQLELELYCSVVMSVYVLQTTMEASIFTRSSTHCA